MSVPWEFRTDYSPAGVEITPLSRDGQPVADIFPLPSGTAELFGRGFELLESLWIEDRLVEQDGAYTLSVEEIYRLEPFERALVGVPEQPTSVTVELRTEGAARSESFRVRPVARNHEGRILPEDARRGPVFVLDDGVVLVPASVAALFGVLDRKVPTDVGERLAYIGDVKEAASETGAKLDRFLEAQDLLRPTGIGVEVESDGSEVVLRPKLEGLDDDELPALGREETVRPSYVQVRGRKKRRVVLDQTQQRTADQVVRRGKLEGADVPRFFDNPEAFLPDEIDLSKYSLRVRGIIPRRYNSQPYIRAQRSGKRGWFDVSAEVELSAVEADPRAALGEAELGNGAGSGGSRERSGSSDGGPPPSISPAVYADMCRKALETEEPYQSHNGTWIYIGEREAKRFLRAWDLIEDDGEGGSRIPESKIGFVLDVISNLEELEFEQADRRPHYVLPEPPYYPLPEQLQADLMPHQEFGYRWLRYLLEYGYGGLLADDMGLGKTVQVISLLAFLSQENALQPSLIVLPKSLVGNWHREIRRFCPTIRRIHRHQGPDRLRSAERIAKAEVVLTTYQTLRRDQLTLGKVDWQVIACDEAQYVKNPTAQSTSAVKGMKAKLRLALTGTPVENGLSELWCIVDFAQPGKLGSQREFRDTFERPIRDGAVEARAELTLELQRRLSPHYVRRTKEDSLPGLPEKNVEPIAVPFGPRQQALYAGVVNAVRRREVIPLAGLQQLIMIASHPELYEESGASIDELIEECPKLVETLAVVGRVRAREEKVVIFTRYRRMQKILQDALRQRFEIHASVLNGEVGGEHRLQVVDRFNSDAGFSAMILSPEAAGVGLNVTGANHVIHYTRLWNPAKENQATDRSHRIGQTRPVTVYLPILQDERFKSVEVRLHELLEEKRELAREVLWPRESLNVGYEEMEEVFGAVPDWMAPSTVAWAE